ncbi:MAG: Rrf2 family transcriptional regulator [Gaiellales bacterium]|nr:MAG: Rrf2 family transcriptional regulator [Gaiellales bacterium]
MEISRQTDYAIRTIEFLSRDPDAGLVQTHEIARQQNIPPKYLPTIIRTLARAGLLKTMRGNHGGVRLARPPEEISLREVVEAIDGPVILNRCLIKPGECDSGSSNLCALHMFWERVTDDVREELDSVMMSDLVSD